MGDRGAGATLMPRLRIVRLILLSLVCLVWALIDIQTQGTHSLIRCYLLRKESLPHAYHPPLHQPSLGQETPLPRVQISATRLG